MSSSKIREAPTPPSAAGRGHVTRSRRAPAKPVPAPKPPEGRKLYVASCELQDGATPRWLTQSEVDALAVGWALQTHPGATGAEELAPVDKYPLAWWEERLRDVCPGCGLRGMVDGRCPGCRASKEKIAVGPETGKAVPR